MTCPSTGSDPTCLSDGFARCPECHPLGGRCLLDCRVGGPHFFEKIDPRDEKQLGMSGWHCAECGCARNGDGS